MIDPDALLEELAQEEEEWQAPFKEQFVKLCERAEKIFPAFVWPKLSFDTYGQAAGWALYHPAPRIKLNPVYCQTTRQDMLRQTLPHEVAHILAQQKFGERGHGHAWSAMFGALTWDAPTRCHSYESVAQAKRKLYG